MEIRKLLDIIFEELTEEEQLKYNAIASLKDLFKHWIIIHGIMNVIKGGSIETDALVSITKQKLSEIEI